MDYGVDQGHPRSLKAPTHFHKGLEEGAVHDKWFAWKERDLSPKQRKFLYKIPWAAQDPGPHQMEPALVISLSPFPCFPFVSLSPFNPSPFSLSLYPFIQNPLWCACTRSETNNNFFIIIHLLNLGPLSLLPFLLTKNLGCFLPLKGGMSHTLLRTQLAPKGVQGSEGSSLGADRKAEPQQSLLHLPLLWDSQKFSQKGSFPKLLWRLGSLWISTSTPMLPPWEFTPAKYSAKVEAFFWGTR